MRLLLLLALLARLAPLPAHASTHCGGIDPTVSGEVHLAHQDGHQEAGHDECPHCPPLDCAVQSHCPQPVGILFMTTAALEPALIPGQRLDRVSAVESWTTRGESPPLRPPVHLLT